MNFYFRKRASSGEQKKKSKIREWIEAAAFAIIAATLIRTFIFEAFVIPSGSMEKTLLIHDYLFVSKITYGPRIPMTPLAWPFTQHTMPFTKQANSYSTAIQWRYRRLPGFSNITRNDVIVFNYPCGDTVYKDKTGGDIDYYTAIRNMGREKGKKQYGAYIYRPVDKRENWIKRCIGASGDTLQIKNGVVFINGQPGEVPPHSTMGYQVKTKDGLPFNDKLLDDLEMDQGYGRGKDSSDYYIYNLTAANVKVLQQRGDTLKPDISKDTPRRIFPNDPAKYPWSEDNFGPLYIPKKGATIQLDTVVLPLYKRIIETYEHNTLSVKDGKIFINNQSASSYTFKMNYFWMMGDNRHESTDSRYWGFVPEDHIVGKAWLIWLSYNKSKIRWGRLFTLIK